PSKGSNRYSQRILRLKANPSVIALPSWVHKRHPPLEAIIPKLVLFAGKRRPLEAINAVPENKLALPLGVGSKPFPNCLTGSALAPSGSAFSAVSRNSRPAAESARASLLAPRCDR